MPNHIKNVLKFKNLKPDQREFIVNNFTSQLEDDDGEGVFPLDCIFDFDKIIPEPKIKSDCPKDCLVNKDSHIHEYEDRPWFDWYEWHNKYWGTKWNAYDGYVKIEKSTITFVFSTAWSAPYPIYEQLAKKYNFDFEVRYADEDWGSNCGIFTCEPDGTSGTRTLYHDNAKDYYKDATAFARRLWNTY